MTSYSIPTSVLLSMGALVATSCGRTAAAPPPTTPPPTPVHVAHTVSATHESAISANAVPLFFPSVVNPCPGEHEMLGDVMKQGMNPQLSRITEALFHDTRPKEERMEAIADSSATILGCVPIMAKVAHGKHDSTWPTFDHFVYTLVTNVSALQLAAQEDDLDEVKHWYQHVKHACASCHARFWNK